MNYHNIVHDDLLNGEGLRVTLFVSGCAHHCPACQNPQTWPPDSGIPFDQAARDEIIEALSKPYISGLTLSGGDPFHPQNASACVELAREVKLKFPHKTVWAYTGYRYEEIPPEYLWPVDVLCDGRYIRALDSPELPWVGSSNQRVIDVPRSVREGHAVLFPTPRIASCAPGQERCP